MFTFSIPKYIVYQKLVFNNGNHSIFANNIFKIPLRLFAEHDNIFKIEIKHFLIRGETNANFSLNNR
jgi:hypothetical protein